MSADAANLADLRRLGVSETLDWWFRDRKRKPHNFNGLCRTLETLLGFADKFTGEHIFPSFGEVSRITGASYRTTQRHVLTLERLGVLRKLKSFISNLRLPYEFSVSRGFTLRLLRRHLETAKGWIKIRIANSLRMLERTSPEGATSLTWRRRNPIARVKDPAAPRTAVSGASIPEKRGIRQIDQLPPALRAGDQGSGGPDAFGAGPSPLSSRITGAPAGASPVPTLLQVLGLLKSLPRAG
jgi:hypothetical protein